MRHGSLFSGIGGFDLAAQWMGWENVFHCECNPFGQRVLKHYWPNAKSYEDITKTDFTVHRRKIDILTGGFPCQPYSQAGKRLGKEDDRHLWPEMLRAIREIQPRYIVGENVSGLVNWAGGLVFEEVQTDLENEGYEVQAIILPACAINAPHRRDRVWFVAYSDRNEYKGELDFGRCSIQTKGGSGKANRKIREESEWKCFRIESRNNGNKRIITDTAGLGLRKQGDGTGKSRLTNQESQTNYWKDFPTQSPVCDGDDGLSSRLDGITFPKWRNESIKAGGNAIVPQVAHKIFQAIASFDALNP